jgi:LysR family transcriptional regulator, regulator for bpeEF and oprC
MSNNNMDYNLLKVFSKVSELGSFTQAAKVLNYPKSRVSRAIARLENELGVQLIRRTTRKTSLTSSGKMLFKKISPHLNGIDYELKNVSKVHNEMSGVIRLTASQDIGQTLVTQAITAFNLKHPNVTFETIITNDYLDLTKENIDIAFRAGKLNDSNLIQKKITIAKFIIVCTKKYIEIYGCPTSIKDLESHRFLSFKNKEQVLLNKDIKINPIITSDSFPLLLNLALNNYGITILPDLFCKEYLKSKKLEQLFPNWTSKTGDINILYPPSKNMPKKIEAFLETINELFD